MTTVKRKTARHTGNMTHKTSKADSNVSFTKLLLPKEMMVVGNGIVKNNVLIESCLQTTIKRWYPWTFSINQYTNKYAKIIKTTNESPQAVAGWGQKKSFQRASGYSDKNNLPLYSIEDGFLRSIDSGIHSQHAVSLVVDDLGVYFNLHENSRLEQMIIHRAMAEHWSERLNNYSQTLITQITDNALSKYNQNVYCPNLDSLVVQAKTYSHHVLVIDQVAGDSSIKGAGASASTFLKMITDACDTHPNAIIWIKAHPAAKAGYLTSIKLPRKIQQRVQWITEAVNPINLLRQVSDVYSVSSHMGFEALLLGKKVHCYGVSWYCGWGLTDDTGLDPDTTILLKKVHNRRQRLMHKDVSGQPVLSTDVLNKHDSNTPITLVFTIEQLFYAAYLDYSHYVDPASKEPCDIEQAVNWLITNRHWSIRLNGAVNIYEFSRWKVPFVTAFIKFPQTHLSFKAKPKFKISPHNKETVKRLKLSQDTPTVVWGLAKRLEVQTLLKRSVMTPSVTRFVNSTVEVINTQLSTQQIAVPSLRHIQQKLSRTLEGKVEKLRQITEQPDIFSVYCMEDGFIRSNGLGATLLAPLSIVLDNQGIYYNATSASDLESLLQHPKPLTPRQSQRIQALHKTLLDNKVSKYNVGKNIEKHTSAWVKEVQHTPKRKLLIVGQVEDDLSVQYCGSLIKSNAELLIRVVRDNPDAFLIYKPHPDVEAGLRTGKVPAEFLERVDVVARDISMPDCLGLIDEIHTISSLTGFEGLLRYKTVFCYGLPFYAGWGLTQDADSDKSPKKSYLQRRQQGNNTDILTLEQLMQCVLIDYPLYRLPHGYGLAQVEQVINYLYQQENIHSNTSTSLKKTIKRSVKKQLVDRNKQRFMQLRHKHSQKIKDSVKK